MTVVRTRCQLTHLSSIHIPGILNIVYFHSFWGFHFHFSHLGSIHIHFSDFSFRQGSVFLLKFKDKSNISFPVKYFQIGIDNKDLLSWNSVARFNCPYFCYCLTRLVMDIFLKYEVNSCNWRLWLFDGSNDLSRILSQATWGIQDAVQCKYTITNT